MQFIKGRRSSISAFSMRIIGITLVCDGVAHVCYISCMKKALKDNR